MRRRARHHALLAILLACAAVSAFAADADPRSGLTAQKLRLVESLIDSPAQPAAAGRTDGTPTAQVSEGRQLLQQAREALAANRHEEAGRALDAALRNAVRAAARRPSRPESPSASAQQAIHAGLREQVATYRAALQDVGGAAAGEARAATTRIDTLRAEAAALADDGRPDEAGYKLAEANRHAVATLSRLRAGQTVVVGLDFATPADEYAYEGRRFDSSELIVAMMLAEGRADADRRALVDGFLREGRRLRGVAAARADSGDHRGAIPAMEQAAAELNRALQAMGIPVF